MSKSTDELFAGIVRPYRNNDDLESWAVEYEHKEGDKLRVGSKQEVAWLLRELTTRKERLDWFRLRDESRVPAVRGSQSSGDKG